MAGVPISWTLTALYGQEYVRLHMNLRLAGDRSITVSDARDAVCDILDCTPAGCFSLYAMATPSSSYRGWLPLWEMYEMMYYRDHISPSFPILLIYHETPIYYQNQPPSAFGIRRADPIPLLIAFASNTTTPAAYAANPVVTPHAAGYVINLPARFHLPPTGLQPIPPTTNTTTYTYAIPDEEE